MAKQSRKARQKPQEAESVKQGEIVPEHTVTTTEDLSAEYIARFTGNQTPPERKALIYSCADSLNMSPQEIARRLEMDARTVKAVLANREHIKVDARNFLDAHALQAAKDWVDASREGARKGKHTPAKDLLLHAKVIEPIQDNQTNVQVAIIVGAPGQPLALSPPKSETESESPSK